MIKFIYFVIYIKINKKEKKKLNQYNNNVEKKTNRLIS